MNIKKQKFGLLSTGERVDLYTVSNKDMSFSVTNFGCTITSIMVPNKNGLLEDIVLGYSTLDGYIQNTGPYFGAFIGRYANRIAQGQFELDGNTYHLDKNNLKNTLHGGWAGYDKMLFSAKVIETEEGTGVRFTRTSPDGEQGFPGSLKIQVTYMLTKKNEIILSYKAKADKATPISLTNHTYFNLGGNSRKTILDHELMLNADSYVPVNDELIPTGQILPVENTPFDFRSPKLIGSDLKKAGGYDHCYVLQADSTKLVPFAAVTDNASGRKMIAATNQPGVQFYSGNFLKGHHGKNGQIHQNHQGFCLETQNFPDGPNQKAFPNCILQPGDTFKAATLFAFSWD